MVPFLEYAELSLVHLVELGAGASLDELCVINLLVGVGLRLVEEYEAFEIGGTLVFKSQAVNQFGDSVLGNVALAVDGKLQVGVARKPCLLGKEPQAESGRSLLLLELGRFSIRLLLCILPLLFQVILNLCLGRSLLLLLQLPYLYGFGSIAVLCRLLLRIFLLCLRFLLYSSFLQSMLCMVCRRLASPTDATM